MYNLLLITIGGAAGTAARYGTGVAFSQLKDRFDFPVGTLAVNLIGCFLIGLIQGVSFDKGWLRPEHHAALVIGVLGGFTTFSAYGWEAFSFLNTGQYSRATAVILLNNVAGIALVFAGFRLSRLI